MLLVLLNPRALVLALLTRLLLRAHHLELALINAFLVALKIVESRIQICNLCPLLNQVLV